VSSQRWTSNASSYKWSSPEGLLSKA
jgi:hypothetical protein